MATNLFNYTSQKLNAESLRQINSFNSYNYAGIVGKDYPLSTEEDEDFERNGYRVTLKATESDPVVFLGAGLVLTQNSDLLFKMIYSQSIGYIKVTLDPNTGTILTDEYSGIESGVAPLDFIDIKKNYTIYSVVNALSEDLNPSLYYYEYEDGTYTPTTDETVDDTKTYYSKYESSNIAFRATNAFGNTIYNYNGNTIWVSDNVFIIPICVRNGSTIEYVVKLRDLKDLEGFLSLESYSRLRQYCEGTFVWTVGGQEEVTAPDGTVHKKGDIGSLNVTDNLISSNVDDVPVAVESLQIQDFKDASEDDRLYVDNFGNLQKDSDYKTPVKRGGTYIENNWDETKPRYSAKQNLGIYYGTLDPSSTFPINPPVEGDIYLKIIDNE